jgi:SAM-dependent MidA family methyltransferase
VEAATQAGFELLGYTTQASFLLKNHLLDFLKNNFTKENTELHHQINLLTSPAEMGELFKVIGFSKLCDIDLQGFSGKDYSYQL